jgi:hypothetical protein
MGLLANDFYEHSLPSFTIELAIKDRFPRSEVKLAVCYCDDNLTSHDGSFQVGVGIVFVAVVFVLRMWMLRSKLFEPFFEVRVKSRFVVIDKDAGSNMHRVDQSKTFPDAAFGDTGLDLWGNVKEFPSVFGLEPEFFAKGVHQIEYIFCSVS